MRKKLMRCEQNHCFLISLIGCRPGKINKKIIKNNKKLEKLKNCKNRKIIQLIILEKQNWFINIMLWVLEIRKINKKNMIDICNVSGTNAS